MTDIATDFASRAAVELVQRQLDAYNARDIDAFMECWAETAQILAWPSRPFATGSLEIREHHLRRFQEPDLCAWLVHRSAVGELVIDREIVTRNFPAGIMMLDVLAIYEVAGDHISRAWFKSGDPVGIDDALQR